jgi:hypothetical protein
MEELAKLHYKEYLKDFNLEKIEKKEKGKAKEYLDEIKIIFKEKEERVPIKGLVQNGYYNPIEIIDFPVGGLATYLVFYRRRWKDLETREEYRNTYEIRFPGTKITRRFGLFLKGEDRDKVYQLLSAVPYLHDKIEEDILVVQKSSIRI